jgi:hypothetical protein
MIEVYLTEKEAGTWELNATVFPQGGLGGLAQECHIASVREGNFRAAIETADDLNLSALSFKPDPHRWPVPEPKFQIINDGSHEDRHNFGNYQIRRGDIVLGRVENFPRRQRAELIKTALRIVADAEKTDR